MAYIYTNFDTADDVVTEVSEIQTAPIWSDNTATLTAFYTSSTQSGSANVNSYLDIYNGTGATATSQFSIAYGHYAGSGSVDYDNTSKPGVSPTRAIYGQYANMLLADGTNKFTVGGTEIDDILVININRARFKEQLDPGNWQLNLDSNGDNDSDILHLVDSSDSATSTINEAGRVYDVVSGSITNGPIGTAAGDIFGKVYVDQGVIILDPTDVAAKSTYARVVGSNTFNDNVGKFLKAITGSAAGATPTFTARNKEEVKSTHYFVRVKNQAYNYSDNPTFVTGSDATLRYADFKNNPNTYITTVGMYDDNDNCLAIAKLSKPLLKSFSREALIKVKLEY
jgi:hypothetical protein